MQYGWLLERSTVIGAKLAIEADAKLAAGAEVETEPSAARARSSDNFSNGRKFRDRFER